MPDSEGYALPEEIAAAMEGWRREEDRDDVNDGKLTIGDLISMVSFWRRRALDAERLLADALRSAPPLPH